MHLAACSPLTLSTEITVALLHCILWKLVISGCWDLVKCRCLERIISKLQRWNISCVVIDEIKWRQGQVMLWLVSGFGFRDPETRESACFNTVAQVYRFPDNHTGHHWLNPHGEPCLLTSSGWLPGALRLAVVSDSKIMQMSFIDKFLSRGEKCRRDCLCTEIWPGFAGAEISG